MVCIVVITDQSALQGATACTGAVGYNCVERKDINKLQTGRQTENCVNCICIVTHSVYFLVSVNSINRAPYYTNHSNGVI